MAEAEYKHLPDPAHTKTIGDVSKVLHYDPKEVLQYFSKDILPLLITFAVNEVQRTGKPMTVFDIINPLTNELFTISEITTAANVLYTELKKELPQQPPAELDKTPLNEMMPMYTVSSKDTKKNDANRLKFQQIVRQFLRSQKPSMQLVLLNRIQKHTPFALLDPRRKLARGAQYGYADLLRFLCNPVKTGEVYKFIKADPIGVKKDGSFINNPFYNPIRYDFPDDRGNYLLQTLYDGSRAYYTKKFEEIEFIRKELKGKLSQQKRKEKLHSFLVILKEIQDRRFDPIYLSKQVWGQQRPMDTYRKDHFFELLRQITTRKKMVPSSYGKSPPKRTGVEIVGPELERMPKRVKDRSKKRRRPKRPKPQPEVSSDEEA